ncbi:MAG: ABC transporter substrate-binding protein [Bernardetiaceae bacterium]|nr:ABC transporter substrate-binding protein [Bernardetiaceae bacterium]
MRLKSFYFYCALGVALLFSCGNSKTESQAEASESQIENTQETGKKIVSLSGALTEIIFAAGYGDKVVGTDVTSTYPEAAAALPKVGHNRNIEVEGVLSLTPTHLFTIKDALKPEVVSQFETAALQTEAFVQEFTIEGTKKLIQSVCETLETPQTAQKLNSKIDEDLAKVEPLAQKPKVLFIYARGAGSLMVAGEGTQMQEMIQLAGGKNAVTGFEDFKPLTAEALVQANPDIILMFDSGLQSLEGDAGLLEVPGMRDTPAGKHKAFISMDGQFLSGFGPRVGEAVYTLNQKFKNLSDAGQAQ